MPTAWLKKRTRFTQFLHPLSPFFFPQTVYCWGSQCCLKRVRLGWGAVSASLGLSPVFSPSFSASLVWDAVSPVLSPVWDAVSASLVVPSSCLRSCLPQLVSHLVFEAVSASSFSCLRCCLPACLPSGLGCCVRLAGRVFLLSTVLSPPACLPSGLGCCVRLAGRVFLLSSALSPRLSPVSSGMLCPPRCFTNLPSRQHCVEQTQRLSLVKCNPGNWLLMF